MLFEANVSDLFQMIGELYVEKQKATQMVLTLQQELAQKDARILELEATSETNKAGDQQ